MHRVRLRAPFARDIRRRQCESSPSPHTRNGRNGVTLFVTRYVIPLRLLPSDENATGNYIWRAIPVIIATVIIFNALRFNVGGNAAAAAVWMYKHGIAVQVFFFYFFLKSFQTKLQNKEKILIIDNIVV